MGEGEKVEKLINKMAFSVFVSFKFAYGYTRLKFSFQSSQIIDLGYKLKCTSKQVNPILLR